MKIWDCPGPGWRRRHVGQIFDEVVEIRDVELLQRLAGERLDRDRHVLNVFAAALCRDDDFCKVRPPDGADSSPGAAAKARPRRAQRGWPRQRAQHF